MDFDALLAALEGIQGKFLLSSFRNESLAAHAAKNAWHTAEVRIASAMTNALGRPPATRSSS